MSYSSPIFPCEVNGDLYACPMDDGAIVLDLQTEKYYALQQRDVSAPTTIEFLRAHGIKVPCGRVDKHRLSQLESTSTSSFIAPIHVRALLAAIVEVSVTRKVFGTRAVLHRLMRLKARRVRTLTPITHTTLRTAVHAFRHLRPWFYTANRKCLYDALVLAHYLFHLGYEPLLVIGVRTKPFEAHAWAQTGDYLIEDFPERIKLFTPILVV